MSATRKVGTHKYPGALCQGLRGVKFGGFHVVPCWNTGSSIVRIRRLCGRLVIFSDRWWVRYIVWRVIQHAGGNPEMGVRLMPTPPQNDRWYYIVRCLLSPTHRYSRRCISVAPAVLISMAAMKHLHIINIIIHNLYVGLALIQLT